MSINRNEELQLIVDQSFKQDIKQKKVFLVNGIFGVGKTWFVNAILEIFAMNKLCDAFLKFENSRDISFLSDYLMKCVGNTINNQGEYCDFTINELTFYNEEYYNLLNKIKHNNPEIFDKAIKKFFISNLSYIKTKTNPYETNQLYKSIEDILTRNSEKRMLYSAGRVLSEALVVDLIRNLFPLDKKHETLQTYIDEGIVKRVLITFDNYDSISCSVNEFLFKDLFPIAYNLKFSEFISQKFSSFNIDTKVSDLIDFRFVLASRQKVQKNILLDDDLIREITTEIELQPFSRADLQELIKSYGFAEDNLEQLLRLTQGIPYIIELWLESKKYKDNEENEKIFYSLAKERINKYFDNDAKEWLWIASHLEKFDENLLRCFHQMHKNYHEIFEFFIIHNDIAEKYSNDSNLLKIKSIIRYYLHNAEEPDSQETKSEIIKIESIYNKAEEILKNYNQKQRQMILNLSYFKRFNFSNHLNIFFQNDLKDINQFVESHQELFIKNQYTYSIIEEYRNKLIEYNKYWDQENYENKQELANKLWDKIQKELLLNKNRLQKELNNIELEEKDLIKKREEQNNLIDNIRKQIIQNENEIIIIKRRINQLGVRNYIRKSGFCFVLGLFVILISIFAGPILKSSFSEEALSTLKTFLQIVAILFGFCGTIYYLKYVLNKSRKREIEKMRQKIVSLEKSIENFQSEILRYNEEISIAKNRIDYLSEKNNQLNQEIYEINAQLRENFV
ncbi:MAG: hypothetical protein QXG00_06275 [Candidatus Woesearchaeota archaeon]